MKNAKKCTMYHKFNKLKFLPQITKPSMHHLHYYTWPNTENKSTFWQMKKFL